MVNTDDIILDPLKEYNFNYKTDYAENAEDYFDELVEKSGVDEEENAQLVKAYKDKKAISDEKEKRMKGMKGLKVFLIILSILLIIAGIVFLVLGFNSSPKRIWMFVVAGISLILAIVVFIIIPLSVNKELKRRTKEYEEAFKITTNALNECWENMAPLNNLFRYNMGADITKKTAAAFEIDQIFDLKKYELLHDKYGMKDFIDPNSSVYDVLSGTLGHSPFLLARTYNMKLFPKTYTGSTTYSWTTTDSEGHSTTHTDTLYAEVVRPAPRYWFYTSMYYGNEFAPNLHFVRMCKDVDEMDERQTEKYVAKKAKQLRKQEMKSTKKGGTFSMMGDEKFEALFEATDRDNEVEFRMMFTPLARKNMVSLLIDDDNYGDDFHFVKDGMLNKISSTHSQSFDYFARPSYFYDYDYKACREKFLKYENEYFKGIYFDLAPVIAIPDYQEYEPDEWIFRGVYNKLRNVTPEETESLVNELDHKLFVNDDCSTNVILKTSFTKKNKDIDEVVVEAHYFNAVHRTEYFSKMGRDGHTHTIAVNYIDYLPRTKRTPFAIMNFETDENYVKQKLGESGSNAGEFLLSFASKAVVRNGLFGFIPTNSSFEGKSDQIKNYFKNMKGE